MNLTIYVKYSSYLYKTFWQFLSYLLRYFNLNQVNYCSIKVVHTIPKDIAITRAAMLAWLKTGFVFFTGLKLFVSLLKNRNVRKT